MLKGLEQLNNAGLALRPGRSPARRTGVRRGVGMRWWVVREVGMNKAAVDTIPLGGSSDVFVAIRFEDEDTAYSTIEHRCVLPYQLGSHDQSKTGGLS